MYFGLLNDLFKPLTKVNEQNKVLDIQQNTTSYLTAFLIQ